MNIHQFFLIVESKEDGYPNYHSASVKLSEKDPSQIDEIKNSFVCSPLFSIHEGGKSSIPECKEGTRITFLMIPSPFPYFAKIIENTDLNIDNQVWFSLGLANLVIIENSSEINLANKVISFLQKEDIKSVTASETWLIKDGRIQCESVAVKPSNRGARHLKLEISEKLPLDTKFIVSEFIITADKILTSAAKFTPQYFENYQKIFDIGINLVNDLCFLNGDSDYVPSIAIKQLDDGGKLTDSKREGLINDRKGRLLQFNSSLSYIYTQGFSGPFPIFDHFGIIMRHSLLGIGSAINALFELSMQLEKAFSLIEFENLGKDSSYATSQVNIPEVYLKSMNLEGHNKSEWDSDFTVKGIIKNSASNKNTRKSSDFFNRLVFYSGRLGFREYDLSITAAIQVLVEGSSLNWNIINFTHEIIHNHVRLILNKIVYPNESKSNYREWLKKNLDLYRRINPTQGKGLETSSYYDLIKLYIINYNILEAYFGSLGKSWNSTLYHEKLSDNLQKRELLIPDTDEYRDLLISNYKDISEIFVHIIDYSYIYSLKLEIYIQSIWTSWAAIPIVSLNLSHYILRTLVVIAQTYSGTTFNRFDSSVQKFIDIINEVLLANPSLQVLKKVKALLEDNHEKTDLRQRFKNCIIIADVAKTFFVADLEEILTNGDENYSPDSDAVAGETIFYDIETGRFMDKVIKSKVRLAFDQLNRTVEAVNSRKSFSNIERTTAWLLLTLSSHYHD